MDPGGGPHAVRPETFVWLPKPVFERTLETHSNHCQREDRAQGLPLLPLGPPHPPLAGGGCVGMPRARRDSGQQREVSAPGSWAPAAGPGLSGQEAGAAWLTVCPWGPDMGSPHRNGVARVGVGLSQAHPRTPPPSPCRPGQPTGHHVSLSWTTLSGASRSEHAESRHRYFLRVQKQTSLILTEVAAVSQVCLF